MNILNILFVILSLISPISYTLKTVHGTVRPHRVTRLVVWVASLTGLIVTFGSENIAGKIFGIMFFVRATYLLILALKYGTGGRSKLDMICLGVGVVGVVVSLFGNGLVGIALALAADLIGYMPAFVKTYHQPKSEEPLFYALESLASIAIIFSIAEARVDIILPVYFVFCGVLMLCLIYRPIKPEATHGQGTIAQ